eukprot:CAMPEP_0198339912 /NCGR_PEP_ID=MMETSP1450-20131203/41565_1 /TAXON_ID=753684 ORGANISM="Madagascaria erythrocladiodes, Strain CCMP3234" /NCGR_SAMPLE_ID=MMETSP1450 /ASSEMBLY_ACC=CAM_ASM_001115 /LENGTH=75 /DNA_ID=CAMNT_0044044869 /DNA_START=430 /DNA_END=657 /DNA_ORIENTATION=-
MALHSATVFAHPTHGDPRVRVIASAVEKDEPRLVNEAQPKLAIRGSAEASDELIAEAECSYGRAPLSSQRKTTQR